jgi:prepilin-type N-terminal cleavage/methylation domain-containing protein
MKTKTQKRWITDGESRSVFHQPAARPFSIPNPKFKIQNLPAFTLIELLVVISIMAVLAALTIPVIHSVKRQQYIRNVQAEMQQVETALENYKAKYGFYPPSNQNGTNSYLPLDRSQFSQLYYELSGTTLVTNGGTIYFSTLDGSSQIKVTDVNTAYGVSGFINCSKGSGEDAVAAKNFLSGLTSKQINLQVTNNFIQTAMLVTSVGGPDPNYQPLNAQGLNPFRYVCPGVNNPNSYDLWIQLSIGSTFSGVNNFVTPKKYLISNWNKNFVVNSPLP